jgi:hypothetical protein
LFFIVFSVIEGFMNVLCNELNIVFKNKT